MLGLLSFTTQAQIISVTPGTDFNVVAATVVSADSLDLVPAADFTINGNSLFRSNVVNNSTGTPHIKRVYQFITATNAFSGALKLFYNNADLNGLLESNLQLLIHNGSSWSLDNNSSVNTTNKFVQNNALNTVSLKEITAGVCTPNTGDTTVVSCGSFVWYGNTYTSSAKPTHVFTNVSGCDSVVTLHLTINQPTTSNTIMSSCGAYTWNNTEYTTTGVYTFNSTNAAGCDSVATLNLTVNTCTTTLNVKAILEGFYRGNGTMAATLSDLEISTDITDTDSVQVNLWRVGSLNNASADYSAKVILQKDGTASVQFPGATLGNSYYVSIKHRNSIETWSTAPIVFTSSNNYDFTTGMNQSYGDGINNPMKHMGNGVYAIYSGDVNQDGGIDIFDMQITENDASQSSFGYYNSDCNGDGSSDIFDLQIIENNAGLFIFYARP